MSDDSKLAIINACLSLTGQHLVAVPDDGSPEWINASAGYETALARLLDEHDWKFAKQWELVEERSDPADGTWGDAYAKPAGCIHVIRITDENGSQLTDWKILGNNILVNKSDGIGVEFIADLEPDQFTGLFTASLKHFIFAGIYRGLKDQPGDARAEEKRGDDLLKSARPRSDLEDPGKVRFISSLSNARRTRRG